MKDEEGSGGTNPQEANGIKRSHIKWKLLLFDEPDLFSLGASLFLFSFKRTMLFILSQIKKHVFLKTQTRLSNGQHHGQA